MYHDNTSVLFVRLSPANILHACIAYFSDISDTNSVIFIATVQRKTIVHIQLFHQLLRKHSAIAQ